MLGRDLTYFGPVFWRRSVWIVQIALKRPYTFVVLALLIAIFGTLAAVRTPADIFPNIKIPVVSVVWTYAGLLPDDMSGRIIYFYERTLTAQVAGIEHIESQSLNSYGVVKIFFQKDVNIAAAVAQVTATSQTVLKFLPSGITPPTVLSYNASTVPILQLALSSTKLPQMDLFDQAQNFIRPQLATVEGAAIPAPYGGKILQVQVDINQRAMQEHNVSAEDVVNAVAAQNLILPAGDEKIGPYDWNVALNASPIVLDQINDLPVKTVNGTVIYVRDVAFVHEGSPPQTNMVRVDGAKAVLMTIFKAGSVSTLDVITGVKRLLPRIKEILPSSINLHAVGDQSIFVKAAIFGVLREAVLAASLVGLMILLFLGNWRSTMIIIVSIPLSILFSLVALGALGETINVMTLGGLALAVGMLVDEGTVTLENIFYHLEQGKDMSRPFWMVHSRLWFRHLSRCSCSALFLRRCFSSAESPAPSSGHLPSPSFSRLSLLSSSPALWSRRWRTICSADRSCTAAATRATARRGTPPLRHFVRAILSSGSRRALSTTSNGSVTATGRCFRSPSAGPKPSLPGS